MYFFVTGWNLGIQHIVSPDEPRYAVAARTMMNGGDLIVPIFNNHPHLEKPVLFHWLLIVSGTVAQFLGISLDTAGFRFEPLFMGWLAVIGICLLGRRLLNQRGAVVAAVILMTTYQFHNTARELVIDMTLTAFLLWSWLFFHVACARLERAGPAFWPLLGFYLCLGLACMSKGPFLVGIFSTVPLLVYLLWTRRLRLLTRAGLWWGAPLSLAMGLSWFVALRLKGYDPTPFFAVENLNRFLGRKDHIHYLPFFFYLHSIFTIFAPWVVFLPFAAWWSFRRIPGTQYSIPEVRGAESTNEKELSIVSREFREFLSDNAKLATCALGISFVIMGVSASKRHLYLLPLFPYLALWVAWFLEHTFLSREGVAAGSGLVGFLRGLGLVLFAGCASTVLWLPEFGGQTAETAICALLGVLFLAAFFVAAAALGRGDRARALCGALAAALLCAFGMEAVARPIHERKLNLEGFYAAVSDKLDGRSLVIVGTNSNEVSWYLKETPGPIDEIRPHELEGRFFKRPGTVLLVDEPCLRQSPVLNGTVMRISGRIRRAGERFVLVVPDPAHPPDPSLLKAPVARRTVGVLDDL